MVKLSDCVSRPVRLQCGDVAMFPDLSHYISEYNVILTSRNNNQNYRMQSPPPPPSFKEAVHPNHKETHFLSYPQCHADQTLKLSALVSNLGDVTLYVYVYN